jgi:toxoflavin biosynthesis protein ToxC
VRTISVNSTNEGHAAPITHVEMRPDGQYLATSSYDGTVIIWDCSDPFRLRRIEQLYHRRLVNASAWHPAAPDVLATASADKTVIIWELASALAGTGPASVRTILARHRDDINSVAWMPGGDQLICGSEDGKATMWDATNGRFLEEIAAPGSQCTMVSVNRAGLIATVGEDGLVAVARPDSAGPPVTRRYATSIEGCAWSHDGTRLAVARDDGYVDLLTDQLDLVVSMLVSPSAPARMVAWSADDSQLVVGAYDGRLYFVDDTGAVLGRFDDHRAWPRSVCVAGDRVVLGSFWSTPHFLGFPGTEIAGPTEPTHGPNALAFDGRNVVIGCDSGLVLFADVTDDAGPGQASAVPLSASPVLSLGVSGDRVFAGTYAGQVLCHDRTTGRTTASQPVGTPLMSLLSHPDRVIAGTYNGEHVVFDADTLAQRDRQVRHSDSVKSLSWLTGRAFVSGSVDGTVTAGDEHRRTVLWEHGLLVNAVATLGGRVVASASRDHTVKVGLVTGDTELGWTVESVQTLLGADESVKCVSLLGTVDAPVVLGGSYDFGLYMWRVNWNDGAATPRSGRLLTEFTQGVSCACQLSDTAVAVAGWDGRIVVVEHDGDIVRVTRDFTVGALLEQSMAEAATA